MVNFYILKKMSCLLAIRTHNEELPYNVSMTYVYCALNSYVDSVHKRLVSNVLVTQGTSEIFLRHSCTSNRTVTFFIEVQVQRTFRQMHRAQISTTLSSQGRLMQTAERFSFSFHLIFFMIIKNIPKSICLPRTLRPDI